MSSAAETAAALTTSTGNAVTAAIMIFIVIMSIMPVIRLAAIMVIYKFTAAVTEPIAPKRIVKCIGERLFIRRYLRELFLLRR
ncbi:MAG: stage III sporulation protein AE [Veillonella parvula]